MTSCIDRRVCFQFQPQLVLVSAGFDAAVGDLKVKRPQTRDQFVFFYQMRQLFHSVCVCVCSGWDVCESSVFPGSDSHVDEFGRRSTCSRSRGKTSSYMLTSDSSWPWNHFTLMLNIRMCVCVCVCVTYPLSPSRDAMKLCSRISEFKRVWLLPVCSFCFCSFFVCL